MSDLHSGRAAIDVALGRARVAQRGIRQAIQGLAKTRDALEDVTYLRLRTPGDIDTAAAALRQTLNEHDVIDIVVLTPITAP